MLVLYIICKIIEKRKTTNITTILHIWIFKFAIGIVIWYISIKQFKGGLNMYIGVLVTSAIVLYGIGSIVIVGLNSEK